MSKRIKLGINGAAGRMGRRIVVLACQSNDFHIVGAYESNHSAFLGRDVGELAGVGPAGVVITSEISERPDVIIDFSTPEGLLEIATVCEERRIPLVAATTGMTTQQKTDVMSVGQVTAFLIAPSMSMAVNVAMKLVGDAARALKALPDGVDVEIVERHHRFKEDAPSGTALRFGEIVAEQMQQEVHRHGREGRIGQRPQNEIGYHALRTGDNVGEHSIVFGMMGETLEVYVRGHTRDSYAYGALAAARFLYDKPPGVYSMQDVLGLSSEA